MRRGLLVSLVALAAATPPPVVRNPGAPSAEQMRAPSEFDGRPGPPKHKSQRQRRKARRRK